MAHHHHHHEDDAQVEFDWPALAELLDLEGSVLHAYLSDITAWVRQAAGPEVQRILDLGAGTGNGSIALARRFGQASVTAVDGSAELLARTQEKAQEQGLAGRIHTVRADLDQGWPDLETADLAWASMSMHHFEDPDKVLSHVLATLRPGGLLAVAEMGEQLRYLPEDIGLGQPGLEARCEEAIGDTHRAAMPTLGSDWGPRLERAGFDVTEHRVFPVELAPPPSADTRRLAQRWLRRIRPMVEGRLPADDLAVLDQLLADDGPASLLHRDDIGVRGSRAVWLARRP
jgi:ubiquinone/menaquinone biosynthesis C-methylase UbiE